MRSGGPGARVRRGAVVGLASALAALGALPSVVSPTSAAWQDAAVFVAGVTAGTWNPHGDGDAVVPGNTGTTVTGLAWQVLGVRSLCVAVTVTTSSYDPVEWRAQVEYAAPAFRGDTAMAHYVVEDDGGWVERLDDTPAAGQIQFRGKQVDWSPKRKLSARTDDVFPTSVTFTLCNRNLPAPAYDPALTYQVTASAPPTDPWNACVTATVAVTSPTHPFYVGWQADVDMSAAAALRRAHGQPANTVTFRSGGVTATRLTGDVYRVTSTEDWTAGVRSAGGADAAVRQSFVVCSG